MRQLTERIGAIDTEVRQRTVGKTGSTGTTSGTQHREFKGARVLRRTVGEHHHLGRHHLQPTAAQHRPEDHAQTVPDNI